MSWVGDLHASGPGPVPSAVLRDFCPFLAGVLTPSLAPWFRGASRARQAVTGRTGPRRAWSTGRWRDSGWWRVIAGEGRVCACALAWLNAAEALGLLGEEPQLRGALIVPEVMHRRLAKAPPTTMPHPVRPPVWNGPW